MFLVLQCHTLYRCLKALGRVPTLAICLVAALSSACSSAPLETPSSGHVNPQDLLTVDCLLPPQLRQLGTHISYLSSRRAIRTSGARCALRGGEYVAYDRADFNSSLAVWMPQAELGDPEAQTYVGEIHEKGLGTRASYERAAHWYQQAAEQNYSRAQSNLGYLYESGLGVERDLAKALNLYRQASGFTAANLEYVSSVEVANREAVGRENMQLGMQVQQLNQQLATGRSELERQTRKLAQSARDIEQLKQTKADSDIHIEQVSTDLEQRKADYDKQSDELEQLRHEMTQTQAALPPREIEQVVQTIPSGPSINIIDPPVLVTRSSPMIRLKADHPVTLIGKVESADALFAFRVNGRDHPVSDSGLFELDTAAMQSAPIQFLAVDTHGNNTRLALNFALDSPSTDRQPSSPEETLAPPSEITDTVSLDGIPFGHYHALIIGNDTYESLGNLRTAANDAIAVEQLLREQYGFETMLLLNANHSTMLNALEHMRANLTKRDNLVIYYAGHGELDKHSGQGFWLPTDASSDDKRRWIANSAITSIIDAIPAKHVLVVADSCYSGTLTKSSVARALPTTSASLRRKWLTAVSKSRVRTVLSSGGVRPVLDGSRASEHSVFAEQFLRVLRNNTQALETYALFHGLQKNVTDISASLQLQQTPQYAPIRHAGHQAGEFIFVPTGSPAAASK